tara:strand:- start:26 stop:193 length:168 start_codon:yes stop_codon:yes gene_type:complete
MVDKDNTKDSIPLLPPKNSSIVRNDDYLNDDYLFVIILVGIVIAVIAIIIMMKSS